MLINKIEQQSLQRKLNPLKIILKFRTQTAQNYANGDLLYHDGLYMSALKADGTYDFSENFQYAKQIVLCHRSCNWRFLKGRLTQIFH